MALPVSPRSSSIMPRVVRGFTLIELMTAVGVVGIMMALAVPSFQRTMANSRVTSAANDLVSAVSVARSEAMRVKRAITIEPAEDGSGYNVLDGDTVVRFFELSEKLENKFNVDSLSFRANGLRGSDTSIGNADAVAKFCDKNIEEVGRQVTISISGSASVETITGGCGS